MRIGVLVDTQKLRGWRKAVFERLLQARGIELALIVERSEPPKREGVLWRGLDALERFLAKALLHRPLARARGFEVGVLDDGEISVSGAVCVSAQRADDIRAANLDAIIDLSTSDARLGAGVARRGLWRIAAREGLRDRLSPLGFWELYSGAAVTEIVVLARNGDDERQVAASSYSGFMWSWSMNDLLLGLRAAALLEDVLHKPAEPQAIASTAEKTRGVGHAPIAFARTYSRLAADAFERATSDDRWRLLLSRGDPLAARTEIPTIIEPPAHSYWADPFVIVRDGQCHIFFEEYLYAERRGVISHVCIDDPQSGQTLRDLKSTVVFDEPHHLSYPFLFTHAGELFMIPESSGARTLEIWRSTDFPLGWEKVAAPLQDVTAADTSLLQWNGKWWLFTNIDRSGVNDHRSELHIFYADDPITGAWEPHARNPVVIDAECGRMAGGFFAAKDGRPIRCGQKQGRKYGEEVSYRLITELTETAYAETALSGIAPIPITPGARTHHVSARDGMIVVDECFMAPKWKRRR